MMSPCLAARESLPGNTKLYLKAENFQHTGSFKIRGALSKLKRLSKDLKLITASSGNHGIACSHAAQTTGHNLTVVLPENVSKSKLSKITSYGTRTVLKPGDSGMAEQHARFLAEGGDFEYISPYNDDAVMAGQGTIGFELLEQLPRIDNVFISMGGGGLVAGIGSVIKTFSPTTKIIGASFFSIYPVTFGSSVVISSFFENIPANSSVFFSEDKSILSLLIAIGIRFERTFYSNTDVVSLFF